MLMPSMKMPRTVCGLFALKQIIRKKKSTRHAETVFGSALIEIELTISISSL